MKYLPLVLVSTGGAILLGTFLYQKKSRGEPLPANALQAKVSDKIATSNDPTLLKQLATGLQRTGDPVSAVAALQKASNLAGVPLSIPGLPPVIPVTTKAAPTAAGVKISQYRVAPGDIPGAIAKRLGLILSQLAKANGSNQKRIMAGQIRQGELLKLPLGAVDTGPANRAKGIAS